MSTSRVSATESEDLCVTYALPEEVCNSQPMSEIPENFTDEYLNATNPYSQVDPLDELDDPEGDNPIYVLVFGDEEERASRAYWSLYALRQLERGDEALVANFGIDIRILEFREWDSDNSKNTMRELWDDLKAKTKHYLGQWYDGQWWINYVDAIIGITAQAISDDSAGVASGPVEIDQGRIFILLKWQVYWADDNLVQHEIGHLFYADDHYCSPCCAMAGLSTHHWLWIWEDGLWFVNSEIYCAYTSYHWCSDCKNLVSTYRELYNRGVYNMLVIRFGPLTYPYVPRGSLAVSAVTGGPTQPIHPSCYLLLDPVEIMILVASTDPGYQFAYWLVDGQQKIYSTTITITVSAKRTVAAYFQQLSPPPSGGEGGGGGDAGGGGWGANPDSKVVLGGG